MQDKEELIQIDGSLYEGGGQMIRSSIALSIILNKQFRIKSIRKNRPNPGINNQLRSVFSAFTDKLPKVGAQQVYFYPHFLKPKIIKSSTAASCTLMLQCLMPIFICLGYDSEVKLQGGTDVSQSPSMESIQLGLTPLLQQMDIKLQINHIKRGYYPTGKGYISFEMPKIQYIKPITRFKFNPPLKCIITYYIKDINPPPSSKQFVKNINKTIKQVYGQQHPFKIEVKTQKVFNTKTQYGIGCLLLSDSIVWDIGTVGKPIQQQQILIRLQEYIQKKCCVDQHHQDQLILFMCLAQGQSSLFIGQTLSLHTQSLIYIVNKFIPYISIRHENAMLIVKGIGYKCGNMI